MRCASRSSTTICVPGYRARPQLHVTGPRDVVASLAHHILTRTKTRDRNSARRASSGIRPRVSGRFTPPYPAVPLDADRKLACPEQEARTCSAAEQAGRARTLAERLAAEARRLRKGAATIVEGGAGARRAADEPFETKSRVPEETASVLPASFSGGSCSRVVFPRSASPLSDELDHRCSRVLVRLCDVFDGESIPAHHELKTHSDICLVMSQTKPPRCCSSFPPRRPSLVQVENPLYPATSTTALKELVPSSGRLPSRRMS